MATTMTGASFGGDGMDIDMDIDIDLDLPEEPALEPAQHATLPETSASTLVAIEQPHEIPAAYYEEQDTIPHKINVTGVDELSTTNLQTYASEHFPDHRPTIEWINDTSVNFVFEDEATAQRALAAFSSQDAMTQDDKTEREAKPSSTHPGSHLRIRVANSRDKKQPRAREASRYYLMHPEEERQSKRQNNRRRRRSEEEPEKFEASMYDDDASALATRQGPRGTRSVDRRRDRDRDRSASPARSRSPRNGRDRYEGRRNTGKELFGERDPVRRAVNNKSAADNLKKELFPVRSESGVKDVPDLFASKMTLPASDTNAATEVFPLRSDEMYQKQKREGDRGFSIKGAAVDEDRGKGFSIRGAAGGQKSIKELFPDNSDSPNAGKELFGGRSARRNKAADLFG